MKKTLLAAALALASASTFASGFYVVVPLNGKSPQLQRLDVALMPSMLPEAQLGEPYSYNFTSNLRVTGDKGFTGAGVNWSVSAGVVPAGLTLNTSSGLLSGTPTAEGAQNFSVTATYQTKAGRQAYQVVVNNVLVFLKLATLPAAYVNREYPAFDFKQLLEVYGASEIDTSKVVFKSDALPEGMTLSANGILSGTPKRKNTAGALFYVTTVYKSDTLQSYKLIIND